MSSTRFPGKALATIEGRPMLGHVVDRVRSSRLVNRVIVATSDRSADDAIAAFCGKENTLCFRGSEQDVLDRFYQAARANPADAFVRITADCPLIDPDVIDAVVSRFARG